MMKLFKTGLMLGLTLGLSAVATGAFSQTAEEAALQKALETRLGDSLKILSVKKTAYAGLYEVRTGNDILYADDKGDYLFSGHVIDTKTRRDFTRERIDEISKIKF